MLRHLVGASLVLVLTAVSLFAADGTVVSYDKDTMKLIVKVADKDKTYELKATTHVHDVDGKEVSAKQRPDKLKKDAKVELVEKNGKLVEINLKK